MIKNKKKCLLIAILVTKNNILFSIFIQFIIGIYIRSNESQSPNNHHHPQLFIWKTIFDAFIELTMKMTNDDDQI